MKDDLLILNGEEESVKDLTSVREIKIISESPSYIEIVNCPKLEVITVEHRIATPIKIEKSGNSVDVEYKDGIEDLDVPVAGNGVHAIFGEGVVRIGIIKGGHITLGKSVREIRAIQKVDEQVSVECMVADYELPTRIDFLSPVPPVIGTIGPNSISHTELRVPSGALENFARHAQWRRAAYIVDADGNTIDNYADKYRKRIEEKLIELKEKERDGYNEIEEAKREKIKALSIVLHKSLGQKHLSKWGEPVYKECWDTLQFFVKINELGYEIKVPLDSSHSIWDKIVDELENIENK